MAQLVKVKFLRNEIPTGRPYTYYSNEVVKIGDLVQINSSATGVVTEVNVDEKEVESFKDKLKFIQGKVKEEEA